MPHTQALHTEFEAIGEDEVLSRLQRNAYAGPDRAEAMRWLGLQSMSRNAAVSVHTVAVHQDEAATVRRLENAAQTAVRAAVLALVVAAASLGLSVRALDLSLAPGQGAHPTLLSQLGAIVGLH